MKSVRIKSISNLFGKFTIILIITGFTLHFLIEGISGFTQTRNVILILALLTYLSKLLLSSTLIIQKEIFIYVLFVFPITIFSIGFWYSLAEINVYITLFIALVMITCDFEFFKKTTIVLTYIILLLVLYEFFTKTYVFVVHRNTEWGYKSLDPVFFGGLSKVFRAKGLFEGPLALTQFAIGIAFLFRDKLKIILIAILLAILANGRLGIVICSSILGLYFINKYGLIRFFISKKGLRILLGVFILFFTFGHYFINEKTIERLNKILSTEDTGNSARLYYWGKAVELFREYNIFHKIFGNSGYYRAMIGNSAENGWLMLLLNNGIMGFLYYIIPLIIISWMSFKLKKIYYYHMFLLFICMFIQTFHLGALASLFYWIIIYSFYLELKSLNKNAPTN